jgi:CheY-like chemotaxis protein
LAIAPVEASRPLLSADEAAENVRTALAHLYDYAFLQNHPLTMLLDSGVGSDGVTRAQRMRRLLLDCIERLRPEGTHSGEETRAYAILTYRCVDGLSMPEIADKLALSRRQAYREYTKGVDAVASLMMDALHIQPGAARTAQPQAALAGARMVAAVQEVERLKETLSIEALDLPEVVGSVYTLLAPRVGRTAIQVVVEQVADLPACMADRTLLRQALVNLFSYALDVIPANGEMQISFAQRGASIQLQVAGRATELPARLTPHPAHREGVGLAVAIKLIEASGGAMTLHEAEDQWNCVVTLPAVESNTVLVIDDNADLTSLYQRFLAGHNLTMVGATSGTQALELAHEVKPALILLDLMLPYQDGWEILQRLRGDEQTAITPIVICSVLNEPDLALAMGADDYITKPVSQETLVGVLRRWLGTLHPVV